MSTALPGNPVSLDIDKWPAHQCWSVCGDSPNQPLLKLYCLTSPLITPILVVSQMPYQWHWALPHCETFLLKCLFLDQSHPWSNFTEASGLDRKNLGYLRLQISAVLRKLLMCTSSSDIINSENMLFLLEAVYITFQLCLNQDLFVQKGCNIKK